MESKIELISKDDLTLIKNDVIKITSHGMFYNGQFIEDAGEAHKLLVNFFKKAAAFVE